MIKRVLHKGDSVLQWNTGIKANKAFLVFASNITRTACDQRRRILPALVVGDAAPER